MVEASRRHGRWLCQRTRPIATGLTRISSGSMFALSETELEEAGARRLLAAVDELSERRERQQLG